MENILIQPTTSRKSYVINRPVAERKKGRKKTPLNLEKYVVSLSSDNSLPLCTKKQRNDDKIEGEVIKIRSPTYEGEMNTKEKYEEWNLGMSKYFRVHKYLSEMKSHLAIYNLNEKSTRW